VILLEKPFLEVVAAISKLSDDFPYENVVYSGLLMSQNWARLAVDWIPQLPTADRQMLLPVLVDTENTGAFDQSLRHRARKMRRLIERSAS